MTIFTAFRKNSAADLKGEENGIELESATNSTDSESESTPAYILRHAKNQESFASLDMKSPMEKPKRVFFNQYLTINDMSSDNNDLPSDETSLSQPRPPEVFVCQFDKDYSPGRLHASMPKHVTMVPTDLLQVPTKGNAISTNSVISSKYMTPYGSVNSLLTDRSFSSSESVDLDYDMPITATRKNLLRSRRKSLSENNIAALCKASSSNRRRSSCGSATISHSDAYEIKIANNTYNLSLPKPLRNKISKYNSYLAISVSQNMVRNKHGGSTDV